LGDGRRSDLLVVLDDATSEIYYAQLVEQESTRTVLAALRAVIENKGLFCALYSDRASHFFETPKAGAKIAPPGIRREISVPIESSAVLLCQSRGWSCQHQAWLKPAPNCPVSSDSFGAAQTESS
jgi:hypothetical protein